MIGAPVKFSPASPNCFNTQGCFPRYGDSQNIAGAKPRTEYEMAHGQDKNFMSGNMLQEQLSPHTIVDRNEGMKIHPTRCQIGPDSARSSISAVSSSTDSMASENKEGVQWQEIDFFATRHNSEPVVRPPRPQMMSWDMNANQQTNNFPEYLNHGEEPMDNFFMRKTFENCQIDKTGMNIQKYVPEQCFPLRECIPEEMPRNEFPRNNSWPAYYLDSTRDGFVWAGPPGAPMPQYEVNNMYPVARNTLCPTDAAHLRLDGGSAPNGNERRHSLLKKQLCSPQRGQLNKLMLDNRKHACSLCDKRFVRPSSLQTHMFSHTGEKPFCCTVAGCNRRFSVCSNMRRHMKTHKESCQISGMAARYKDQRLTGNSYDSSSVENGP